MVVGQAEICMRLEELLAGVRSGDGRSLFLVGPAGIGKDKRCCNSPLRAPVIPSSPCNRIPGGGRYPVRRIVSGSDAHPRLVARPDADASCSYRGCAGDRPFGGARCVPGLCRDDGIAGRGRGRFPGARADRRRPVARRRITAGARFRSTEAGPRSRGLHLRGSTAG